eukprot:657273-Alexandrium_andersonii.AAC.1
MALPQNTYGHASAQGTSIGHLERPPSRTVSCTQIARDMPNKPPCSDAQADACKLDSPDSAAKPSFLQESSPQPLRSKVANRLDWLRLHTIRHMPAHVGN